MEFIKVEPSSLNSEALQKVLSQNIRIAKEMRREIVASSSLQEAHYEPTDYMREPELEETFDAKVVGLLRYTSFEALLNDFDMTTVADASMSKGELLDALQEFYTPEKQNEYGIVGIKIELL